MRDDVPLREYVDQRFDSADRSLDKATAAMDKRLDAMNEFRQSLRDQNATFVTRELYDNLVDQVNALRRDRAYVLGAAAVIGALVAFIVKVLLP